MKPAAYLASLRRKHERPCPECGKLFTAIVTARFCSSACKQRARRRAKKEAKQ